MSYFISISKGSSSFILKDQFEYVKIQSEKRLQYEALRNNYRVCGVYSPEPCAEVYCMRLWGITTEFVGFIPQSLVLRSIV